MGRVDAKTEEVVGDRGSVLLLTGVTQLPNPTKPLSTYSYKALARKALLGVGEEASGVWGGGEGGSYEGRTGIALFQPALPGISFNFAGHPLAIFLPREGNNWKLFKI